MTVKSFLFCNVMLLSFTTTRPTVNLDVRKITVKILEVWQFVDEGGSNKRMGEREHTN